jgi:hypothetical protein
MKENEKELVINIGDEYKIKIEDVEKFKDSVFRTVYRSASKCVNEIVRQTKERNKSSNSSYINTDSYNNVVCFVGERGTGKSSTMLSFANAIVSTQKNERYFAKEFLYIYGADFLSIDIVDPSLFSRKDTLLEIIISKMFLKFQKSLENGESGNHDHEKKRKLIKCFQSVYENLKTIHNGKESIYERDTIEALSALANGSNLKQSFHDLTAEFLKYFNKEKGSLVVTIDDFDLNISGAYSMLESIRQFLIQDNIIILMACKMEQLHVSITQEIAKEIPDASTRNQSSSVDKPTHIANKYLTKLLPLEHRISVEVENELFRIVDESNKEIIESSTVERGLLSLIYDRAKIFIRTSQYGIDTITPNTLREIVNVIKYVNSEKEVGLKKVLDNNIFENLEGSLYQHFNDIKVVNIEKLNQYICMTQPLLEDGRFRTDERRYRKSPNNIKSYENYSFNDVFQQLTSFINPETVFSHKNYTAFLFYLKVYYSMRVYAIDWRDAKTLERYFYGGLYIANEDNKLFPNERATNKKRDLLLVSGFRDHRKELNEDQIYWVCAFLSFFGEDRNESKYRLENIIISNYDKLFFNPIAFLHNSFFPEKIHEISGHSSNTILFGQLKEWRERNFDYFKHLFANYHFIELFLELLRKEATDYRDSALGDFSKTMKLYVVDCVKKVLSDINTQYPYTKLTDNVIFELIENNPIIRYWLENEDRMSIILNRLFESSQTSEKIDEAVFNGAYKKASETLSTLSQSEREHAKKLATEVISRYRGRYFSEKSALSRQGAKKAMNNLTNNFKKFESISRDLREYRFQMNTDLTSGLKNIKTYLETLANG